MVALRRKGTGLQLPLVALTQCFGTTHFSVWVYCLFSVSICLGFRIQLYMTWVRIRSKVQSLDLIGTEIWKILSKIQRTNPKDPIATSSLLLLLDISYSNLKNIISFWILIYHYLLCFSTASDMKSIWCKLPSSRLTWFQLAQEPVGEGIWWRTQHSRKLSKLSVWNDERCWSIWLHHILSSLRMVMIWSL